MAVNRAVAGFVMLCCGGLDARAGAQGISPVNIEALPAFIDATVPKLMEEQHIAGAAVAVVYQGRVIDLRGFGKSRLDAGTGVDPSRSLFRIGSVTKLFTAAAALQLVETGAVDLQRDVREYLPEIPLRYGATTHQLLTHTAGLLERFAGAYTGSPEHLQPLSDHLRRYTPDQVMRPGSAYSYSNYHYALAGLVIERRSGLPYETYMADRVLRPLRMTATTARQPPDEARVNDLARGYRWVDGHHEPIPYTFTHASPAGSMTTTAADMSRFMLAVLGDGSVDGERFLRPESVKMLLAPQYTPDPRIPATTYGFSQLVAHGQHLLYRGGTLGDQASMVVLAPADRLGIFVASNSIPGLGDFLFEPLMTHLAGPAVAATPPTPLPDAIERAPRFAGTYRNHAHTRDEMSRLRGLMPMIQSPVIAESDGAIRWQGRRWLQVEPLVFRRTDSLDYIVFRENERGDIAELHASGGTYERIGWWEQAPFHLGVLGSCVIAFLAYPLSRGIRALKRRHAPPEGRAARGAAVFVALINLAFVAGLAIFFRDLGATIPLALPVVLWLSLGLASAAVTVLLLVFAGKVWRERCWTRGERLRYLALVVCAVAFVVFLNYWKLLGIRY
jgi:CubicO group peptidase (beta-lactamase class C family)